MAAQGKKVESDEVILRYLYSVNFDPKKTEAVFELRNKFTASFPLNITSLQFEMLNIGAIYLQGRDRHYRPVITL